MPVRRLRAALTAILLGAAVVGTAALVLAAPAQALTVSSKVASEKKPGQCHPERRRFMITLLTLIG